MNGLPKDVLSIVDRYVFDYNYTRLRSEYKDMWLNKMYDKDHKIYWVQSISEGWFETIDHVIAHRRSPRFTHERPWEQDIYRFGEDDVVAKIPKNY